MRRASFLALAFALVGFAVDSAGQMQPKGPPAKPQAVYQNFRDLMAEGRFDIAASSCKAFLDSNPTDADFLEIEKKHGTTAFTQLRTVPKWSDDAATEKKARANVEEAVKRSRRRRARNSSATRRASPSTSPTSARLTRRTRLRRARTAAAWATSSFRSW